MASITLGFTLGYTPVTPPYSLAPAGAPRRGATPCYIPPYAPLLPLLHRSCSSATPRRSACCATCRAITPPPRLPSTRVCSRPRRASLARGCTSCATPPRCANPHSDPGPNPNPNQPNPNQPNPNPEPRTPNPEPRTPNPEPRARWPADRPREHGCCKSSSQVPQSGAPRFLTLPLPRPLPLPQSRCHRVERLAAAAAGRRGRRHRGSRVHVRGGRVRVASRAGEEGAAPLARRTARGTPAALSGTSARLRRRV
jgi:hypothetical protein